MPYSLSSDAMCADEALSWLIDRPRWGLRVRDLMVWSAGPEMVSIHDAGGEAYAIKHGQFLVDFEDSDFYPLDTADYGGAA